MNIENEKRTLEGMLQEVKDRSARKADYIANTSVLDVETVAKGHAPGTVSLITLPGEAGVPTTQFTANDVAFDQMSQKAGLETRTARRLQQEYPAEFDGVINAIHQKEHKDVMLRTFMGNGSGEPNVARAVVSDKFKTFDDPDLLEAVLPVLIESPAQWEIVNSSITDKRLTARFKSKVITGDGANVGDPMAHGIGIGNSEVAFGSVSVAMIIWALVCLNGMQTEKRSRSAHLTSSRADAETWSMLKDETKAADNAALSLKLADIAGNYASRESFDEACEKMRAAANDTIDGGIAAAQSAVEALGGVLKLSKVETSSVLDGLMTTLQQDGYRGQPLSRATLVNAVTAVGNATATNADDVDDWQRRGGKVLDLPANQWSSIATAYQPELVAA